MEESHERQNPQQGRNNPHFTTSRWRENGEAVCREHNIYEQTFYRWKKKYGGMELTDAKRFKALEKENGELIKMLAEAMLENRVLKEGNSKKG